MPRRAPGGVRAATARRTRAAGPLGLCLDGTMPIARAVRGAQAAERAGLESVWVSEQVGHRDAISTAAAVLAATRRIRVIPMALSPFTRHPVTIAAAIAALAEWKPGRVGVAVGPGAPGGLRSLGIAPDGVVTRVAAAAESVRRWLDGAAPDGMPPLRFATRARVPVYLTATRPAMLRAAARFDGVVLSGGLAPASVRWSTAILEGRPRETPEPMCPLSGRAGARAERAAVAAMIVVARGDASRDGQAVLQEFVVAGLRAPHHRAVAQASAPALATALAALAAGDTATADRAVTGAVAREHGLVAGDDGLSRLAAWRAAGVDLPVLWPVGGDGTWRWLSELVGA
jgi:5,10-methylenetetrahydromethanopterin reductase